jgi:hypothetical protein
MQKICLTTLGTLFVLLSSTLAAQDDNYFRNWRELADANENFSQAATENGRTAAFLEYLGEDSKIFRGNGPVDARELYQRNQAIYRLDQLTWRDHFIDVSRDGDLGITVGPNMFTASDEIESGDERQQSYSHIVNVWHKIAGDWKSMAFLVVNVPGFLSMDVEPDYRDTQAMMAETAHPASTANNDTQSLIDADNLFGLSINFQGGQRALLRYGLANQRVYLAGMAPATGAEAASTAYGRFLDNRVATTNPINVTHMGAYLSTSKELGYTYGTMTTEPMEGRSGFRTNYIRVWRFTTSNEWRIAMEFLS